MSVAEAKNAENSEPRAVPTAAGDPRSRHKEGGCSKARWALIRDFARPRALPDLFDIVPASFARGHGVPRERPIHHIPWL